MVLHIDKEFWPYIKSWIFLKTVEKLSLSSAINKDQIYVLSKLLFLSKAFKRNITTSRVFNFCQSLFEKEKKKKKRISQLARESKDPRWIFFFLARSKVILENKKLRFSYNSTIKWKISHIVGTILAYIMWDKITFVCDISSLISFKFQSHTQHLLYYSISFFFGIHVVRKAAAFMPKVLFWSQLQKNA